MSAASELVNCANSCFSNASRFGDMFVFYHWHIKNASAKAKLLTTSPNRRHRINLQRLRLGRLNLLKPLPKISLNTPQNTKCKCTITVFTWPVSLWANCGIGSIVFFSSSRLWLCCSFSRPCLQVESHNGLWPELESHNGLWPVCKWLRGCGRYWPRFLGRPL